MSKNNRYLFPLVYAFLLLPVVLDLPLSAKTGVLVACTALALFVNTRIFGRIFLLLVVALGTLTPLLIVVQSAVCWSPGTSLAPLFAQCVVPRSLIILLNAGLLSSAFLLAAANEWRGSLVTTVNGMWLPRNVRMVSIVAGAMIGEFRRAALRVHQAFTGRGEALPAISWRNMVVLPSMLGVMWAAVLNGAVGRMKEQWSSERFWETYAPSKHRSSSTLSDLAVLAACGCVAFIALVSVLR